VASPQHVQRVETTDTVWIEKNLAFLPRKLSVHFG